MALGLLQTLLDERTQAAPMPATAVAVVEADGTTTTSLHGIANLETGEAVTPKHWWDLASLTKMLVTLPEVLALVDAGEIRLSSELSAVWPTAAAGPYGKATFAQLLSYDAGAPPTSDVYKLDEADRDKLIANVLAVPRERPAGSGALYSDVGMILLGEAVTAAKGKSLAELADARGWCRFGPITEPAVATERCQWRKRLVVGEVHDENAVALGGMAGHAGAFGTLASVAAAALAWLTGAVASPAATESVTRCWSTSAGGERFGLGFRLTGPGGMGGDLSGAHGFGASGFVGNRLWVEPERGYAVVILSNRIHPERGPRTAYNEWCDRLLEALAARYRP